MLNPAPEAPTKPSAAETDLREQIRQICHERPGYGYPRVTAVLNRQRHLAGLPRVNHKHVYRLMREESLLLKRFGRKPSRTHEGQVITMKSDMRYASDIFHISCWNGDLVRVAFVIDCCDREVIAAYATMGGMSGAQIRDLMVKTVEKRFGGEIPCGHAVQWLSDNGPQYAAHETVAFGRELGFLVCTTPAYCPESNGLAEGFIKRFKHDYVYVSSLPDGETVAAAVLDWLRDYNENAPHSGLKMMSPKEFRNSQMAG